MGCCGSKENASDTITVMKGAPPSKTPAVERPTRKLRTDAKVRDVYKIGRTLGTGGFAVVKLGTDRETGEEYAIKIMGIPDVDSQIGDNENSRDDIFKEIDILVDLQHPNVIYLKEYFEEQNRVYLITELLTGGELLDAVLERGSYNEGIARDCFVQLLRGIAYLHSRGVVHRDLKLENLLLAKPNNLSHIKIADFGLAKKTMESQMHTICGTPQYVAPEVIQGTAGQMYGAAVDLWSAGVVLFILLGGYPPFFDESEPALFSKIRTGRFAFDDPVWDAISADAKDLIRQLLETNPRKRLTAEQALRHRWCIAEQAAPNDLSQTRDNLRRIGRNKFKGAVQAIIAQQRLAQISRNLSAAKSDVEKELQKESQSLLTVDEAVRRFEGRLSESSKKSLAPVPQSPKDGEGAGTLERVSPAA